MTTSHVFPGSDRPTTRGQRRYYYYTLFQSCACLLGTSKSLWKFVYLRERERVPRRPMWTATMFIPHLRNQPVICRQSFVAIIRQPVRDQKQIGQDCPARERDKDNVQHILLQYVVIIIKKRVRIACAAKSVQWVGSSPECGQCIRVHACSCSEVHR